MASANFYEKSGILILIFFYLFKGFQNVSEVLAEKTTTIGGAKDLAMDLQKRANDLAGLASNKPSFLSGKFCSQLPDVFTNEEFQIFINFVMPK